ncbi:DNA-3-methyladenine glycosylase I [Aerococcus kribbianus]|uniref:DNA-3-methyladenine glycosylase I n=1 Tax=Aerococcus kribbianus TaxID=2999064 RepID=A0A9X3JH65_9LACT|nr:MULTISPECIES: DNA-3-methyladenine glycosylase I [unclassified Aerococcus]MCZ0717982.1 DNA-3-methyladenine glycosylase I [Aerococcus sp. YH-aer221]MCZ0726269.1 DNA-3-methyladenine glycosylase I [Aerococcus sp. YH-aer222]
MSIKRCHWAQEANQAMQDYHDYEWGQASYDSQIIFEYLCLEIMQAGLSWQTIINKRQNFQTAFDYFDYNKIAHYSQTDYERLIQDAGIVRNKRKIKAIINNASCALAIEAKQHFSDYIWQVGQSFPDDEAKNTQAMVKRLKDAGFQFVGPNIIESFLEAIGIYDHHEPQCDWYKSKRT